MSGIVAVQSKKGENTAEKAFIMLKALKLKNLEAYRIVSHRKAKMISLKESKHLDVNSSTIIGYAISKAEQDRIQSWKFAGASLVFDGRMYLAGAENAESAIAVRRLQHDHVTGAKMLANQTKGDFVFVLAESERIIAGKHATILHTPLRRAPGNRVQQSSTIPAGYTPAARTNGD